MGNKPKPGQNMAGKPKEKPDGQQPSGAPSPKKRGQFAVAEVLSDGAVRFRFHNGVEATYRPDNYPGEIREKLVGWGLREKLRDSYADLSGIPDSQRIDYAVQEMDRVHKNLMSGVWAERSQTSGGRSLIDLATAFAAVCQARGIQVLGSGLPATVPNILDSLRSKTKEELDRIRSLPEVAAELARLRARDAAAIDLSDLASGL